MENLFVAYYRVSTEDQGRSGLGLTAQTTSVMEYINRSGKLVGEFSDVESGMSDTRSGMDGAIKMCKEVGATLVVKELSRISRSGLKAMVELQEAGIQFIESTSPYDQQMMKGFKFVMAQDERDKISSRTSSALAEIKSKIERGEDHYSKSGQLVKSLGNPQNLTDKSREKSAEVRTKRATDNLDNRKAGVLITTLREAGKSFYYITKKLNTHGFTTSMGNNFSEVQTKRLYLRYQ